jgi:hypothetical protein
VGEILLNELIPILEKRGDPLDYTNTHFTLIDQVTTFFTAATFNFNIVESLLKFTLGFLA